MIATSGFLTDLECTKFVFSRGFAPDSLGKLTPDTPRPLSWFKGDPTSKGKGRGGKGKEGREWKGGKGKGGEKRLGTRP